MRSKRLNYELPIAYGKERYAQAVKLVQIAEKMKEKGVRVDLGRAQEHYKAAVQRAAHYERLFLEKTGLSRWDLGKAGAGQTDAVRDWFWEQNNSPKLVFDKKTKKPQFNSPLLTAYAEDYKDTEFGPAAAALLGLRKAKTAAKFAEAYRAVGERHGGRIHFSFNIFGTKGERWSSSASWVWRDEHGQLVEYSLNAQNVPSKEPEFDFKDGAGKVKLALSLRDCFIPDPGCAWIKWDYEALELRLIEANSGSRRLAEWAAKGLDPHIENAKLLFLEATKKVPPGAWRKHKDPAKGSVEELVNLCREAAKPIAYGATYQYSDPNRENEYPELYKQLKKLFPQANDKYFKVLVQRYYAAHPEIVSMQQRLARGIQQTNKVELPVNHGFLYLPATNRGFNQAINSIHQSGGGALINRALVELDREFPWADGQSAILLQVHDELDAQCPENKVAEVEKLVADYMSKPATFGDVTLSVKAEGDVGSSWGTVMPLAKWQSKGEK